MVTVEIDERTIEDKELLIEISKRPNAVRKVYINKQTQEVY